MIVLGWLTAASAQMRFVPDGRIDPDNVTVLMACDAQRPADLVEYQPGSHGKFHVSGWRRPDQRCVWTVRAPKDDDYAVTVILRRSNVTAIRLEVSSADATASGSLRERGWQRVLLPGLLRLTNGANALALSLAAVEPAAAMDAQVLSVELIRPAVRAEQDRTAAAERASTSWMREAGHGFMVHWTSQSCPRHGEPKSYAEAVRAFDVEGFADQMKAGGAGFVVFTTAHAFQYFPAPLGSLDRVLPGRTASRDLIADLARALRARGIRLMLYYNAGAASDPEWLKTSGFWSSDTSGFWEKWRAIVSEVGQRYGENLAGWWFDDGAIMYYHRSPDWRALTASARAGNPHRIVGFNTWEYPSPTAFQDFHCGEGNTQPDADGTLKPDGRGLLGEGPHQGLQACATVVFEGDWGHFARDREIGPSRWTAKDLRAMLDAFARHGNVPIFNLEIYQEGRVSPATIDLFRQMQKDMSP